MKLKSWHCTAQKPQIDHAKVQLNHLEDELMNFNTNLWAAKHEELESRNKLYARVDKDSESIFQLLTNR